MFNEWITVTEAKRILGCNRNVVYDMIKNRDVRARQPAGSGGRYWINKSDIRNITILSGSIQKTTEEERNYAAMLDRMGYHK